MQAGPNSMSRSLVTAIWLLVAGACQHVSPSTVQCVSFAADGGHTPFTVPAPSCWYFASEDIGGLSLGGMSGDAYLVRAPNGAFAWVKYGEQLGRDRLTVVKPQHSYDCLRATADGGSSVCVAPAFRSLDGT